MRAKTQPHAASLIALIAAALAFVVDPGLPAAAQEAPGSSTPVPNVIDARIVGDQQRVRFIADVTARIDAEVFTLADPYRIVIDLPEVRFALPEMVGRSGRGLVSAFRYGLISSGKSRIVLDLTAPVRIDKTFVVDPADGQPARVVVDVVPTTREAFLAAIRAFRESNNAVASAKQDRVLVSPGKAGDKPVVVLDPGHGGIDAGARGDTGALEKDITLAFAKVLGAKLTETGRFTVHLTRNEDTFVALGDRVAFAQQHRAGLFVSIHANSFRGEAIRGATIYTASDQASDKMAAAVAELENQSDVLAGIDIDGEDSGEVKDILLDLTRRETRNFGVAFARNLVTELRKSTRLFKIPHQQASFKVLEAPDVPSALIELGYLSNSGDEKALLDESWREKAALSVTEAIGAYFRTHTADRSGQ